MIIIPDNQSEWMSRWWPWYVHLQVRGGWESCCEKNHAWSQSGAGVCVCVCKCVHGAMHITHRSALAMMLGCFTYSRQWRESGWLAGWGACTSHVRYYLLTLMWRPPLRPPVGCGSGAPCISSSHSNGRWSEGKWGCGAPSTLFSVNQFSSKGPSTPSGRIHSREEKM